MKYLKTFNENIGDSFYQRISDDEFWDAMDNKVSVNVDKKEVDLVRKVINQISRNNDKYLKYQVIQQTLQFMIPESIHIIRKRGYFQDKNEIFVIWKKDDEWYYIEGQLGDKFYKCDQLDGLIECVKFLITKDMKQFERVNENSDYLNSEDFYMDLTDRLYNDIDDYFRDKKRFFPLKVQLNRRKDGEYFGSVCMASGWIDRMNDEEQDWLGDKLRYYKDKFGINFSACADSWGGGDSIYKMENSDFPKHTSDYFNFPPNPFPKGLD